MQANPGAQSLRDHPAYYGLVQRYYTARRVYASDFVIQRACQTLHISERAYCNRFLWQLAPIVWAGTSASPALTPEHFDLAFQDAGSAEGRIE